MQIPEDLKYTKDHEWVKLESGAATVGITEFAQAELGDIVFVELPEPGKSIKQKESLCVVESTKAASDVYAPVGGSVQEVNAALKEKPELINQSPYGEGWLIKLSAVNSSDCQGLMNAAEYQAFLGEKAA